MKPKMKSIPRNEKLHIIVSQLLYPAFLGALIYGFFEPLDNIPALLQSDFFAVLFVFLIFIHYSIDYIYIYDEDVGSIYNLPRFILDIFLIFIIYISAKMAMDFSTNINYMHVGILLSMFKFLSFLWECAGEPGVDKKVAIPFYVGFGVLYLVASLYFHKPFVALALILFLDVAISYFWEKISSSYLSRFG